MSKKIQGKTTNINIGHYETNPKVTYECDFKGRLFNIHDIDSIELEVEGVLKSCSGWNLVSTLNQVGQGSFSVVYEGYLKNNNTNIIKKFAFKIQELELFKIEEMKKEVDFNIQ